MNWQKRLPGIGALAVIAGAVLLLVNSRLLSSPNHTLDFAAWSVTGFGALALLLGVAPPQIISIFAIPELRKKIFITLGFLVVYRIGYYVPLPMIDQEAMSEKMSGAAGGAVGKMLGFVSMFSGGNMSNACVFAMGIMPYISASIIMQLLSSGVVPSLEKLKKEGQSGQKKINEYTRYLTVPICLIQSYMIYSWLTSTDQGLGLLIRDYADSKAASFFFGFTAVLTMTCGCLFLMWLGEQIDEYGIGNGISLIIMAGIIARIPDAISSLAYDPATGKIKDSIFTLGSATGDISFEKVIVLAFLFVTVIVGVIAITKAQRRIPTQSAKHVRGRRTFGGTRNFLPMKVNAAGVMPVIFASTLLILPGFILNSLYNYSDRTWGWAEEYGSLFSRGSGWVYNVMYIALIYVFCYFWVAITFNPKEVADGLKDSGSFIPGYRPGKSTSDYLERVLMRITYVGAAFLAVIAIIPTLISSSMNIPPNVASFFGGTGLLIVISVALDLVQKINSHLVMRNYQGLTDD
ncbi:MAG: preprotein translocase subunit SecY [Gemmataceae bacterium]